MTIANENIELDPSEVNALIKAIRYLKFECEESDSSFYGASPIINSILAKLTKMYGKQSLYDKIYEILPKTTEDFVTNKLARYSVDIRAEHLDDENKKEALKDYLFPYKLTE